jgi:hypothetical protein
MTPRKLGVPVIVYSIWQLLDIAISIKWRVGVHGGYIAFSIDVVVPKMHFLVCKLTISSPDVIGKLIIIFLGLDYIFMDVVLWKLK